MTDKKLQEIRTYCDYTVNTLGETNIGVLEVADVCGMLDYIDKLKNTVEGYKAGNARLKKQLAWFAERV